MEAALGWIGDLVRWVVQFFPHSVLIRFTHAGVKFKRGRHRVVMLCDNGMPFPVFHVFWLWYIPLIYIWLERSGLHWYWPVVTEYETYPIKRQTTTLDNQTLCTQDGKVIGVGGIVVTEIEDIELLLTETYDPEDTIRDYALNAITDVVSRNDFAFLQGERRKTNTQLTSTLRNELKDFGVKVIRVSLSDFVPLNVTLGQWQAATSVGWSTQAAAE